MNYEDVLTRVIRNISVYTDYAHNRNLYEMEEGEKKNIILDLYTKAKKLGNEISNLLSAARILDYFSGDLEELCDLTDKHWKAVQELYRAIGQDEYDRMITYSEDCVRSPEWRESYKDPLKSFYKSG